ncbi:FmdB family zinc ribbon protein [Dokdonella sp. MW10]|uniref:FmdB family zinc ribbon protein n=1 Tax=Dokdonella sp. MW10 TaxID=2992926 RepID=UPI003F823A03
MPIYEFECPACGHRFERLQKLSDPDPTDCPECGGTGVKRCLTAPAFRLSGSGWYETDFKKDGDKKRNLTSKEEGGSSSATSSGGDAPKESPKTEPAKPAPKSDTPAS